MGIFLTDNTNQKLNALTCRHNMRYNVGIMNDTSLQLTIRGLDPETKKSLVNKANKEGISLNRYVLKTLKQSAGIDESESRYLALKQFLNKHHMISEDKTALDEALIWADKSSIMKQKRDEA